MTHLDQQAWLWVEPCLTCGAMVGHPCVTTYGVAPGTPTGTHSPRLMAAFAKRGNVYGIPVGGYVDIVDRS